MADVDCCVVGAGFAGLTAALRLKQGGHSVAVLEARDRVGGRTFTEVRDDGTWIDRGGAWIGPGQDRVYSLMSEFGVPSYKQYCDGAAMMIVDGKRFRYRGTIPFSLSPWTAINLGVAFAALGQMCKAVPLDAPWNAKKAAKWDQITVAQWLGRNARSRAAHDLLETAIAGTYTSAGLRGVAACSRCTRWRRAADRASCSASKARRRIRARSAGMGAIYRQRLPPSWAAPYT